MIFSKTAKKVVNWCQDVWAFAPLILLRVIWPVLRMTYAISRKCHRLFKQNEVSHVFSLDQLEVIGCKEVPVLSPAMPRLLSPIFAVRNSDTVLFPPYTITDEEVIKPDLSHRSVFDYLASHEEVSIFGPVAAIPKHELWLNDNGEFRYDLSDDALKNLKIIFKTNCEKADAKLRSGEFAVARLCATIAYSANSHSVDPLVYRAAAEYLMIPSSSDPDRVKAELSLTEIVAQSHLPIPVFQKLYLDWVHCFREQKDVHV